MNLLGCVLFGVAAVAGYVVGSSTSLVNQSAANLTTAAGAACFLACAIGTGRSAGRAAGAAVTEDRAPAGGIG